MRQVEKHLSQGIGLHQAGRLDEAWTCYEQVLKANPREPNALHLSGVIATQRGDFAEAVRRIGRAIALAPTMPLFHINLGNALQSLGGKVTEAEAAYRRAISINPGLPAAHHNLANLLLQAGREDEALAEYDQTLVCDPHHANALLSLAKLLSRRNQPALVLQLTSRLLERNPGHRDALLLAAEAQFERKDYAAAHALLERVVAATPDDPLALGWKAIVLDRLHRFSEAIAAYRETLTIQPDHPVAASGLADVLTRLRRPEAATRVLLDALQRQPDAQHLYSHYLFQQAYFSSLTPQELLAAHREWNTRFASDIRPLQNHQNWLAPAPGRRLRVAYLSADFKNHSVAFFIEPILERHHRDQFEVVCYAASDFSDEVTARLRQKADLWRPVATLEDGALCDLIVADRIDILIDLSGHTAGNRLKALARKPAPVQITYLGYPSTTGVEAIDYRITDARAEPPGEGESWNSETLLRLPECFHCYRPGEREAFSSEPPVLASGTLTFASFNVLSKISDPTCAAWARILHAVPDAVLLIKTLGLREEAARNDLISAFARHGIASDRLRLDGTHLPHADHMRRYREVDICLDTFPYNGTTTTCDALWMGVPVVSFCGDRHVGRVGLSLLHAVGLTELVAESVDEYVAIASRLARDHQQLARYHASLRERMSTSPLMDEERFVGHLEAVYREVWSRWCDNVAARSADPG